MSQVINNADTRKQMRRFILSALDSAIANDLLCREEAIALLHLCLAKMISGYPTHEARQDAAEGVTFTMQDFPLLVERLASGKCPSIEIH